MTKSSGQKRQGLFQQCVDVFSQWGHFVYECEDIKNDMWSQIFCIFELNVKFTPPSILKVMSLWLNNCSIYGKKVLKT